MHNEVTDILIKYLLIGCIVTALYEYVYHNEVSLLLQKEQKKLENKNQIRFFIVGTYMAKIALLFIWPLMSIVLFLRLLIDIAKYVKDKNENNDRK